MKRAMKREVDYCSFENKSREICVLRKQTVRCLKSRPRDDILTLNIQI